MWEKTRFALTGLALVAVASVAGCGGGGGGGAGVSVAAAAPQETPSAETHVAEPPAEVTQPVVTPPAAPDPLTALQAINLAGSRRIDFVMIGDSNQVKDGYGFAGGLLKALAARYGEYATGIGTAAGSEGVTPFGASTGAPPGIEAIWPTSSLLKYSYVADSATFNSGSNGLYVSAANAIGVNNALRFHFAYGTFDNGAGGFKASIRQGSSPFTAFLEGVLTSTNTGAYSMQIQSLDLPAAARNAQLEAKFYRPGGTAITGPFVGFFARAENVSKTAGVSAHTLYAGGGQSMYDMAKALIDEPDQTLTQFFKETRRLQLAAAQTPIVIVYINSGLNDRNETSQPSLGPNPSYVPDGAAAYIDNLDAIRNRINEIWSANGWDQSELYFLVVPSHVVASPDDAKLAAYRAAAVQWSTAHSQTDVVDFSTISTAQEMVANAWYLTATDYNHLTSAGYNEMAARLVSLVPH